MSRAARLLRRLVAGLCATAACAAAAEPSRVEVDPEIVLADPRPVGINLGTWRAWGAEQLGRNVLQNPGFEGVIDRAIVVVRGADAAGFGDDATWLARPPGFWAGAAYDVRTGAAAGHRGRVRDSGTSPGGWPRYLSDGPAPELRDGDIVALTRVDDMGPPERWMPSGAVEPRHGERRPGSSGARALALRPAPGQPAAVVHTLDAIAPRAGTLLPVKGRWRLALWTRVARGDASLHVRLARHGSAPFVDQTVAATSAWHATALEFDAVDDGPAAAIELRLEARGDGELLLDDVELAAVGPTGEFRAEVVAALRALRPGYLRDWQGGQGATLANRLADPFGRRLTRSSPAVHETIFEYGLPAFLDLCEAVGADPWVVVPTTFSDAEWRELGSLLTRQAARARFAEVLVEFGNENWNPLSRAAGIGAPPQHGAAAARAFALLRAAADPTVGLRAAVNGQFASPAAALGFATAGSPRADLLAVAPYFLFRVPAGLSDAERLAALFPDASAAWGALATGARAAAVELAVSEVNVHATGGDAPSAERDAVTVSAAAGTALAARILDAQAAGVRRIAAYELAGFDMWTDDRSDLARLWGVMRDLGGTRRPRPTGLAVALLNQAIVGPRHAVGSTAGNGLRVAAYRGARGWAAVIASADPSARTLEIRFPPEPAAPGRMLRVVADSPWRTNEAADAVRLVETAITPAGSSVMLTIPPLGLVALLPG